MEGIVTRHPAVVGIDLFPRLFLQNLPHQVREPVAFVHKHAFGGGTAQENDNFIRMVISFRRSNKTVIIYVNAVWFSEDIVGIREEVPGIGEYHAGAGPILSQSDVSSFNFLGWDQALAMMSKFQIFLRGHGYDQNQK
jgi:hypothetical protein